jgi:RNase P subunit RPR2
MSGVNPKSKICRSCSFLTPPELLTKRISRSNGRQTTTFRCKSCDSKGRALKNLPP